MECICMQIRAEEQEDEDKKDIALMGSTNENIQPIKKDENVKKNAKTINQIIEKAQGIRDI